MKRITFLLIAFLQLTILGCKKDLHIENNNSPDFEKVYASGDDLENLASGLFNTWYSGTHSYSSVYMMLATAADNITCSWGNQAMRDMSWEPRKSWDNSPSYGYNGTTKFFFDRMYSVINTSSNILKAMNGGVDIGEGGVGNIRTQAFCKFGQGIGYGHMALYFDKGFVVDENITFPDASVTDAISYQEVAAAALGYLDEAISLCSNTFTIPASWLGTANDYSNTEFAQLCNSMAARIMANLPRNNTELLAVDWAKVKSYADNGITSDFTIQMDGYNQWYNEAADYLTFPGWGKTDMYVVHLMDNTQPAHWDDNASFPAPPESTNPQDERLNTDFEFSGTNWFRPERGYYHYSNYRQSRWDASYALGVGPAPELMLAENELYRAEARAYLNDLPGAATIINSGTRVTRGNMPAVPEDLAEIVKALHHERYVELMITGVGLQFFDMRKLNLLQAGTPLHWPLPAKTLETFGETLPFYTYGGVDNADGITTSNGGWR